MKLYTSFLGTYRVQSTKQEKLIIPKCLVSLPVFAGDGAVPLSQPSFFCFAFKFLILIFVCFFVCFFCFFFCLFLLCVWCFLFVCFFVCVCLCCVWFCMCVCALLCLFLVSSLLFVSGSSVSFITVTT